MIIIFRIVEINFLVSEELIFFLKKFVFELSCSIWDKYIKINKLL